MSTLLELLHNMKLPELSLRETLALDVASALSVHAIYKHYEPDASLLLVHFLLLIVVPSVPAASFAPHFQPSGFEILSVVTMFNVTLVASIVLYRVSPWHPLAKYPGPVLAKISKYWAFFIMAKGKNHIYIKKLHETYGSYVRIGPNEISVLDVSAISSILGADGMPKGPIWSARTPKNGTPSIIAIRSMHEHARRRKRWNRGFNTTAIKGYEPILQKRALQLAGALDKQASDNSEPSVNLAQWLSYFAADFMGDMAFGGGFELMRDGGDREGFWTMIESGVRASAVLQHIPWIVPLLHKIPLLNKVIQKLRTFGSERAHARKVNGSLTKDLFYHLIDEDHVEQIPPTDQEIASDGIAAVIAGSDTTSTTLSGLFYFLLSNPLEYKRLQKEVDSVFPLSEGDPFDTTKLAEIPFLNAVINETLRLQPAVPSYLQRAPEAGSGGKWIGDRFIPEGTAVVVPPYALFRNPAYFSPAPDTFWPDRWLHHSVIKRTAYSAASEDKASSVETELESEVITNTAAFIPFSYGPANCAGRALALTEMRMVVALLIQRFEIQFAPDYDPNEWEKHLEDFFVMCNGELRVTISQRM